MVNMPRKASVDRTERQPVALWEPAAAAHLSDEDSQYGGFFLFDKNDTD